MLQGLPAQDREIFFPCACYKATLSTNFRAKWPGDCGAEVKVVVEECACVCVHARTRAPVLP